MKRFHGESECPPCGCGSNDLKSEASPFIVTVRRPMDEAAV